MVSRITHPAGRSGARAQSSGPSSEDADRLDRTALGSAAESRALAHLQQHGLRLVSRNYRVAAGPGRRAGEIDLILRDRDGTLVFVEVRARGSTDQGGAAASIGPTKQRRLIYAAQRYLMRHHAAAPPPCRFDVVAIDGDELQWIAAAFDAGA